MFGFEIMPAPFVVAHLQVGLTMQGLDAPLSDDDTERAGIFPHERVDRDGRLDGPVSSSHFQNWRRSETVPRG